MIIVESQVNVTLLTKLQRDNHYEITSYDDYIYSLTYIYNVCQQYSLTIEHHALTLMSVVHSSLSSLNKLLSSNRNGIFTLQEP